MLSAALTAFAVLNLSLLASADKKCKCLPGDDCFPDQATWDTFAQNLSLPLISGQKPLASVCYESSSDFDAGACASVSSLQFSHTLLADAPNGIQWKNYEEHITNTTVEGCPFEPAPNATCFQGRVPSYAINVSTVADVQNTIQFASEHNLHLVVKNAGHENLGRMYGVGSVELFVHNLQESNFTETFVPEGAPDSTAGEPAVTIQPGVQWGDLYALAEQHNHTIVGGIGAGGTVGAGGGWPLGTGHGILSPYFGLGVDNVLEMHVVLPNTSYVIVNAYQNTDLYWALRGGGGPSFGVVLSLTYRLHPNPPFTAAFFAASADSNDSFLSLFETFNQHHNAISDAGWAGFWPWLNNTLYLTLLAQGDPPFSSTANETLEQFFADARSLEGVNVSLALTKSYPSFNNWYHNNFIESENGIGFNYSNGDKGGIRITASSWILPRDLFDTHSAELAKVWLGIPSGRPFMVGGGLVASTDPDSAATTPAWRTAITDMTLANEWEADATAEEIQKVKQGVFDQIQPLRELAPIPAGGQYINEPDALEVDWQHAYWGDHYERLLAIKKEVDPKDLFIVFKGVNSEAWDEDVVCKTV